MNRTDISRHFRAIFLAGMMTLICVGGDAELPDTGIAGGLILKIGCGDGIPAASLRKNEGCLVLAVDTDAGRVAAEREAIRNEGCYGAVIAELFDGINLPLEDNIASLVVAKDTGNVPASEIARVLRPGGKSCVGNGGRWVLRSKPVPEEIDEWSHYLHDASNDGTAHDTRVGPPARLRWKAGPMWERSHEYTSSLIAMVSAGGRIYYIFDEGLTGVTSQFLPEKWMLTARDAFSGVLLWKKQLHDYRGGRWNNHSLRGVTPSVRRLLVADRERVYLTPALDAPVSILEGTTGKPLATCDATERAQELRHEAGVLLVHLGNGGLAAFGSTSGNRLWQTPETPVEKTLAAKNDKAYFFTGSDVVCLDLKSGSQTWRSQIFPKQKIRKALLVVNDHCLLAYANGTLSALNCDTGNPLWKAKAGLGGRGELFVTKTHAWRWEKADFAAHDLLTGEVVQRVDPSEVFTPGHHLRCYQGKATDKYIISPFRGAEFISITGDKHYQNDWVRGPCTYGVMPANGLLYAPPHPCFCYPGAKLYGFNALAPAEKKERYTSGSSRLTKGPAYDRAETLATGKTPPGDWPMYRHDKRRTGSSTVNLPAELSPGWNVELGGRLTAPVCANGRIFVARKDSNTLFALDADNGSQLWSFVSGGGLDSPPTVLGGVIVFGARDGHVYCLRAEDGQLAWKFRAAPSDRRIVACNRLESPWPSHGSVLPYRGLVYCTAGRSTFLDGGIRVFGLDPGTGKTIHQTLLDTGERTREDAEGKPFIPAYHIEGALSDILVCENDSLYLGQYKLDRTLAPQECPYIIPGNKDEKVETMDLSGEPYILEDLQKVQNIEKRQRNWIERAAKDTVARLREEHGAFNVGHRHMGRHVLANFGLLDDSWFNRTFWMYSETWPGFYLSHVGAKSGQLLVVGPKKTYAVQAYPFRNMQSMLFTPGETGYLLLADDNDNEPALPDLTRETTKGWGFLRKAPPVWYRWVSVLVRSMALAGDKLFIAGAPDIVVENDPMASFEGRKGGILMSVSSENGERLSTLKTGSMPIFDGLIAARGKLYMSTTDGRVLMFGD